MIANPRRMTTLVALYYATHPTPHATRHIPHTNPEDTLGQYWLLVDLDKRQFLYSHSFGDGLKLAEFGTSGSGMMTALALLLADGNGRGGGDIQSENPIVGSWSGDRIVAAGDYADGKKFLTPKDIAAYHAKAVEVAKAEGASAPESAASTDPNLYAVASVCFENISAEVVDAMCDDAYLRAQLVTRTSYQAEDRLVPVLLKARAVAKLEEELMEAGFDRMKVLAGRLDAKDQKAMADALAKAGVTLREERTVYTSGAKTKAKKETWAPKWAVEAYIFMKDKAVSARALSTALKAGPEGAAFKAEMAAASLR